jgi:hypothetical protein
VSAQTAIPQVASGVTNDSWCIARIVSGGYLAIDSEGILLRNNKSTTSSIPGLRSRGWEQARTEFTTSPICRPARAILNNNISVDLDRSTPGSITQSIGDGSVTLTCSSSGGSWTGSASGTYQNSDGDDVPLSISVGDNYLANAIAPLFGVVDITQCQNGGSAIPPTAGSCSNAPYRAANAALCAALDAASAAAGNEFCAPGYEPTRIVGNESQLVLNGLIDGGGEGSNPAAVGLCLSASGTASPIKCPTGGSGVVSVLKDTPTIGLSICVVASSFEPVDNPFLNWNVFNL